MKTNRERQTHFARVFWIAHQLAANRYPNARSIGEHFEVSAKTGQRTLDFMRDQLRLPIAYSAEQRGWYYTEPTFPFTGIEMTEGELLVLLLAERMAQAYKGTAIGKLIDQVFAKVLNAMTNSVSIDINALTEAYSFETAITSELDDNTFRQLGRAIIKRLSLQMAYFTATRGQWSRRLVDPLHLRNYLGEWYLIAFDHRRGEIRDFHVGRIRELEITETAFTWPESFDLQAYLDSGFAMIRGGQPIAVEFIFDEYQARWMRERGKAHKSEEREELPDGRLRMRMQVTALDGVKRFVMQYGAHVEVIAPEELRQAIRKEIEAMSAMSSNSLGEQRGVKK
ncbi:MAG: WYL domain-containing protein [Acidobacteria bacterium]|nr:WYL domain-containing protein [Acidobacteriota bacterium]